MKIMTMFSWLRKCSVVLAVFIFCTNVALAQMSTTATKEMKMRNAMSAAPEAISANATIMDWPKAEGEETVVLKKGTNGWTCYPDMPQTEGNDPMCVDKQWVDFFNAYMKHESPKITKIGIAYMLAGDSFVSNTDPWATKETPDNEWGQEGPHLMIAVPDTSVLAGMNTDRTKGEPYVMFRHTPYAHIMIPVPAGMKMNPKH